MRSSVTQTFRWTAVVCLTIGLSGGISGRPAVAAEGGRYASPTAAYHDGLDAWRAGRKDEALRALEYASDKGVLGAMRKLATLYASGEGVPQSDARAFVYYQNIADEFADTSPRHPLARQVSEAFVALATYHRSGIAEIGIKPDPVRAVRLYRHAASYFGDVTAQYSLARMYLDGEGVNTNVRLAINWLANAAKKQHAPSQALLGDLLWRGKNDHYHRPLKGLALLSLARQNAAGTPDAEWIDKLYADALGSAQPDQREQARLLAARWHKGWGGGKAAVTALPLQGVRQQTASPEPETSAAGNAARADAPSSGILTVGTTESDQPR